MSSGSFSEDMFTSPRWAKVGRSLLCEQEMESVESYDETSTTNIKKEKLCVNEINGDNILVENKLVLSTTINKQIESLSSNEKNEENLADKNKPGISKLDLTKCSISAGKIKSPTYEQFKAQNYPTFIINTKKPLQIWKRKEDVEKTHSLVKNSNSDLPGSNEIPGTNINIDTPIKIDDSIVFYEVPEVMEENSNQETESLVHEKGKLNVSISSDNNFLNHPSLSSNSVEIQDSTNAIEFEKLVQHNERNKLMKVEENSDDDWAPAGSNKRKKNNRGKQPAKSATRKKSPSNSSNKPLRFQENKMIIDDTLTEVPVCPMCYIAFPNDELQSHAPLCEGYEKEINVNSCNDQIENPYPRRVMPRISKKSEPKATCPVCHKQPNLNIRSMEDHVEICLAANSKGKKK